MNNKKYCPSKPPHVWKTDEGRSKKNTLFIHTSKPCTLWLSVIEIGFIWCLSQCSFGGRSCKHTETRWEELSQANSDDSWRRAGRLCVLYLTYCNLQYYWKKKNQTEKMLRPHFSLSPYRQKHSLCDFVCQPVTQRITPNYCQIPTAVWTLLSSICPAQLPWNDLETAWGLSIVHPILWTVRGGWQRTETFTWFPRLSLLQHCGKIWSLF